MQVLQEEIGQWTECKLLHYATSPGKLGKIGEKIANSYFIVLIGSLGHREPTIKSPQA